MSAWEGRDVLVVGLGVSGYAAARALLRLGAHVRVTELAGTPSVRERADELRRLGAEIELGAHSFTESWAGLAVVSPGIPPGSEAITQLVRGGAEIWSEVELAYRIGDCTFLAVTGTNGKTTTTSLLAAMLAEGGERSVAGGNIGVPLVDAVEQVGPGGVIAVEVSSFQLATIHEFRPEVAVLLNVAPDHLDYHGDLEGYAAAKARIVENQASSDVLVCNADDPIVMKIAAQAPGRVVTFSASDPRAEVAVKGTDMTWRGEAFAPLSELTLEGQAGIEDALAAAGAALEHGVDPAAVRRALAAFRPLAHRLQRVALADGVEYVDDSKATNPHATLAALRGRRDVVLIAGGRSKGNDLSELRNAVPAVIAVVALGEAAPELQDVFADLVPVDVVPDMRAAVAAARARAVAGGSVLLAPGCASLDMYTSYAARGDDFARCVREIMEGAAVDGDA
ncbi:MAG TPA: UDP-N-acetylmuramoyl-L-alanine--D-glutamate ligase [Actinomycetota bacterium]|nr:UDP-N-acetylmuramoyl-L-alanine--D-glutamate ligase [Actinomycetota bacterium]